jgi:hypothetical protein
MYAIGFSLRGKKRGSVAVGDKVTGTVFDVGEPCFVKRQGLLAGVVQSLGRNSWSTNFSTWGPSCLAWDWAWRTSKRATLSFFSGVKIIGGE